MTATQTARVPRRPQVADPLIGAGHIAAELAITRNHAWKLLVDGVFGPPIDVASPGAGKSQLRIRRSQLDAWITSRTVDGSTPAA